MASRRDRTTSAPARCARPSASRPRGRRRPDRPAARGAPRARAGSSAGSWSAPKIPHGAVGRAYVGNFGFDRHRGEPQRPTCLARVDPDGTITRAADDLLFPKGTVITPDGRTLIVAETLAHRLTAFDVGADGALANRRVLATLANGFPDGICLDAEGAVWVAGAYACMLGGPDRRTPGAGLP